MLNGYGASFTQERIAEHELLLEQLQRCFENTEFSMVCFAYPDGTLYRNDGAAAKVSHRNYFQRAMQGEYVVEFLEDNSIDNTTCIGWAVPVIFEDEIAGVLLGLYEKAQFQQLFDTTFTESSGLAYICSSEGTVMLGTAAAEQFLAQNGMALEEDTNFLSILDKAEFSYGSKEQVESDINKGHSGQISYRYDGAMRYSSYLPLGVNDWYIVSILHESILYQEAMDITGREHYLIIIAAVLLSLFIIIYLMMRERKLAAEERETNTEIKFRFEHDSLTGLLREHVFRQEVQKRLKDVVPRKYCIIYLDLDRFKLINEMFGYTKGNELLCALGEELQKFATHYNGLAGRISGDSFVLFMPHEEEIIRELHTRKYREKRIVPIELYFHYGIYRITDMSIPVDRMVDAARLAEKTIKGSYDDYIAYYDEHLKERLIKESEIINSMEKALEDEEFIIHLQPQYNYRNGHFCGAEALVRWNSPQRGLIPPGEFIPVFENNGFIMKLDEYVWERVCQLQRKWLDQGKQILPISINVSRVDLLSGAIAGKLNGLIQKYGLTPEMIRVEITESAYKDNPQQMVAEIRALVDGGFTVEMDDFGSGYSSLNMLKEVPFQVLKTDLNFMSAAGSSSRKDRILDGIIRMAHGMGMLVIAEGVETREQADYLLELDCEYMQGYYFAKPVSVEEYERIVFDS